MCIMPPFGFLVELSPKTLRIFFSLFVVQIYWGERPSIGSLDCLYYAQRRWGLGLIYVTTQARILEARWVVWCFEGLVP